MDAVWDFLCVHSIVEFHRWVQSMEKLHPMSPGSASQLIRQSIWLATFDGKVHKVEGRIAMLFPLLRRSDFKTVYIVPAVDSARLATDLPSEVGSSSLTLILEYLHFFQAPGRSNEEIEAFFLTFWISSTPLSLCELLTAARSLDVSPLVDITTCALLRMICDMTAEEFSKDFHIPEDLADLAEWEDLSEKVNLGRRYRLINQLVAWKKGSLEESTILKDDEVSISMSSSAVDLHEHYTGSHPLDIFLYLIDMEGNGPDGEGNGKENRKKEWTKNLEGKNLKKEEQAKFLGPLTGLNGSEIGRILSMNSTEDSLQYTVAIRNGKEAETTKETDDGDEEYISAVSEPERLEENDRVMNEFYTCRSVNNPWSKPIRQTWAKVVTQIGALAAYVHERNRDNYILPSHVSQDEHAGSRNHVVQIDNGGVAADNLEVALRNDNGEVEEQNNNAEVAAADNREVAVPSHNGKLGEIQTQINNREVAAADNRGVEVRNDPEEFGAHIHSRKVEVRNAHEEVAAHTCHREVATQNHYSREVAAAANREVDIRNDHEEVAAQIDNREIAAPNDDREDEVQNDKFLDSDADQSHNDSPEEETPSDFGNDGEDTSQSDYREADIRAGRSNAEEAQKRTSSTETESSPECNEFWSCCFWPLSFAALLILGFLLWGND